MPLPAHCLGWAGMVTFDASLAWPTRGGGGRHGGGRRGGGVGDPATGFLSPNELHTSTDSRLSEGQSRIAPCSSTFWTQMDAKELDGGDMGFFAERLTVFSFSSPSGKRLSRRYRVALDKAQTKLIQGVPMGPWVVRYLRS